MKNAILNLQFQFSQLFNIGFNRKKFDCISTPDKLYAINTSKNTFIALLFTLFSCGLLFTGLIEAFSDTNEITIDFVIIFFVIHLAIGILGLRQFLWLINGKQEMIIENEYLTITKKGTFFTKPKIYSLNLVTNVREAIDEDSLSLLDKIRNNVGLNRKIVFGHIVGQILFDYKGKTIKLFSDLDKSERRWLINEIEKWSKNLPLTTASQNLGIQEG
jgi:hypothetical protein